MKSFNELRNNLKESVKLKNGRFFKQETVLIKQKVRFEYDLSEDDGDGNYVFDCAALIKGSSVVEFYVEVDTKKNSAKIINQNMFSSFMTNKWVRWKGESPDAAIEAVHEYMKKNIDQWMS